MLGEAVVEAQPDQATLTSRYLQESIPPPAPPGNRQHIVEGIESFPEVFRMLFRGENHGKLLLRPL